METGGSNMSSNHMDAFLERHGLLKTWVAAKAGMPQSTLSVRLSDGRLLPEDVSAIEYVIRDNGKRLSRWQWTSNNLADLDRLKTAHGIMKTWIVSYFPSANGNTSTLDSYASRKGGFTPRERETIEIALAESAGAMQGFRIPSTLIKRVA